MTTLIVSEAVILSRRIVKYFRTRPTNKFDADQRLWDHAQFILQSASKLDAAWLNNGQIPEWQQP